MPAPRRRSGDVDQTREAGARGADESERRQVRHGGWPEGHAVHRVVRVEQRQRWVRTRYDPAHGLGQSRGTRVRQLPNAGPRDPVRRRQVVLERDAQRRSRLRARLRSRVGGDAVGHEAQLAGDVEVGHNAATRSPRRPRQRCTAPKPSSNKTTRYSAARSRGAGICRSASTTARPTTVQVTVWPAPHSAATRAARTTPGSRTNMADTTAT